MTALDELMQRALEAAEAHRDAERAALACLIDRRAFGRRARGLTARQVADETGLPGDCVEIALAALDAAGLVESIGLYHRITPAGLSVFPHLIKE